MARIIYSKFSNERNSIFNIRTDIVEEETGKRRIIKSAQTSEGIPHIERMLKYEKCMNEKSRESLLRPNRCISYKSGQAVFEYIEGRSLESLLDAYVQCGDSISAWKLIEKFIFEMKKIDAKNEFVISEDFEKIFGKVVLPAGLKGNKNINIDTIFPNIIEVDGAWQIIDYEWSFDFIIPVNFVIYRAIYWYIQGNQLRMDFLGKEIYAKAGLTEEEVEAYAKMEKSFQKYVKAGVSSVYDRYREFHAKHTVNIAELFREIMVQVYWAKGDCYKEEDSRIYQILETNRCQKIDIEIPQDTHSVLIRFGNKNCLLKILKLDGICGENQEQLTFSCNGMVYQWNSVFFRTVDPWIEIKNIEGRMHRLVVEFEIRTLDQGVLMEYLDIIKNNQMKASKREHMKSSRLQEELDWNIARLNEEKEMNRVRQGIIDQQSAQLNSLSWKLAKPLRAAVVLGKKIPPIRKMIRGGKYLKHNGGRATVYKALSVITGKTIGMENVPAVPVTIPDNCSLYGLQAIPNVPMLEKCDKKIAIHIHLFYEDLLGEFLGYLNHMPFPFDLYISCGGDVRIEKIKCWAKSLKKVRNIVVKKVLNRGRDIAPLYVLFGEQIRKYDYFMHAHSKKSYYSGEEKIGWRQYSLNSILGSEELIRRIFWLFENEKEAGLIYPEDHGEVPNFAYSWLTNSGGGRDLLKRMEIPFDDGVFSYPLGSFFWARTAAVQPIFDLNLSLEDFPEEKGQTDGTLAHALERVISHVSDYKGYHNVILDYEEGMIRRTFSTKAFRHNLCKDVDSTIELLENYDIVSFDIFDTLITRKIYRPDDLFFFMEKIIFDRYGIETNYLQKRKQAERLAWEEKRSYTNIHDIYAKLPEVMGISVELSENFKTLEISLEKKLLIPRKDMLDVFRGLLAKGKRIILVSDMYLPSDILKPILGECGYFGYEELYVSCECGFRKDLNDIWTFLDNKYSGQRRIHVGDNMHSDCQNLCDSGRDWHWIPSPQDLMKLSNNLPLAGSVKNRSENSLALGLMVNQQIFNSPFALKHAGQFEFHSPYEFGFSVFGPLFYEFIKWVDDSTPENSYIGFLAREGYILKQVYEIIRSYGKGCTKNNCYLLASRRAVTVAGIETWEDVRNIVKEQYQGYLKDMIYARLGISLTSDIEDILLDITPQKQGDVDLVMSVLESFRAEVFERAQKEKETYLMYLRETVPEKYWKDLVVVDVGYGGTIQYFLAKMIHKKVAGKYLATFGNTKPDKIGCSCVGMYENMEGFCAQIHRTQLFLEAVLQAPCGQLICFENEGEGTKAVYKKAEMLPVTTRELQNGILDYCRERAALSKVLHNDAADQKVMEVFYEQCVNGIHMSEDLASIFEVEDDYCSNGFILFDKERNCWEY